MRLHRNLFWPENKNIFYADLRPDRANPRADRDDMKPERIDEN